jgi:predicted RNA-binding protein Jag
MSLNLDAGAFVVSGTLSSTVSAGVVSTPLVTVAPCELDIAGFQVYAGTAGSTPTSFNIKVTPPTVAPVYARTYNYNYATAKNIAIASVVTDGTTLTFTTSAAHSLSTGDVISITGSTLNAWNLKDAVVASATSGTTTFTVKYPEVTSTAVHTTGWNTATSGNITIGTSTITFVTNVAHGLKTGDKVTITGVTTTTAANVTAYAVTVISGTSFSIGVATTGTPGGTAKILSTIVSNAANPIVATKGKVVDAVQLVTDNTDYNVAPNFAQGTVYYAYLSDQVLSSSAVGATFGAASALGNADSRIAGKIPTGSKIELEVFVAGTSLADVAYAVEFKKK